MRRLGFWTALVVIFFLAVTLAAVQFAGNRLFGLPFSPSDLYDWLVRSGPGVWQSLVEVTTGFFTGRGQSLAEASQTAEVVLSLGTFLTLATTAGLIFYLFVGRRPVLPDGIDGITIGAVFGVPMLLISLFAGRSLTEPILIIVWLLGLYLAWGLALSYAFRRLMRPVTLVPGADATNDSETGEPLEPEAAARLDRRQFLLQFGASTAAITAISATAGALLANEEARTLRPFPIAGPDFLANQSGLLDNFRRFAIVSFPPGQPEAATVATLGAEYPDRAYVSVWLGEGSPIVVYENLETALSAYRSDESETTVVWLDG